MSAGAFVISSYRASYNTDQIHPIKIQPETLAASANSVANNAPSDPPTSPISAVVSRGKRTRGLIPRTVTLRLNEDQILTGYLPRSVTIIPVLLPATFGAWPRGAEVDYLGAVWTIIGRSQEEAR